MTAAKPIASFAGHRDLPERTVSRDEELRAYTALVRNLEELGPRIARHTSSPTAAAYFVQLVERVHRATGYAQLAATDLAQRTLVHELRDNTLVSINECLADPAGYLDGDLRLPEDPATPPAGRPIFKDTTDFLQNTLRLGFVEARERVLAASRLFPRTDVHGIEQPPKFPLLARDLATGKASPDQLSHAARKLERLQPEIKQYPNAGQLAAQLEAQVAESVREEDPRTTHKLFNAIQASLEQGVEEPSEEVLRAKIGMFYRGTRAGIAEFLLRSRAADAEVLLSLCAQMDNPRTMAGDRGGLARQADSGSNDPGAHGEDSPRNIPAAGGNDAPPEAGESLPDFPDFLIDPETGQPLTDPARANSLALEPVDPLTGPGDAMNGAAYGSDGLTAPQRHLQGLMNLVKTNGRPRSGTKTTGLPSPEMFILTTLAELEGRAAHAGLTAHGQRFTPAELRQQLCIAGAIPVVMGGAGRILDLGRAERYFPDYMRAAILALYGGCIFPGCTVPPEHCEIDHFDPWENGGTTNINDGRPLCTNHHHARHTGLIDVVRDADGLFSVILPASMDPERRPRRNRYWRQFNITPTLF